MALAAALLLLCGSLSRNEPAGKEVLTDNEDRVQFLAELGWTVQPEPLSRQEIILPREFSPVFESYNRLQQQQGYDLQDYKGLTVTLYTYQVTNWPEQELTVLADLYIYRNRVIAGDIHATAMDGFMIGLH